MPTPKETAHAAMVTLWREREECARMCNQSGRKSRTTIEAFTLKDAEYRAAMAAYKAIEE